MAHFMLDNGSTLLSGVISILVGITVLVMGEEIANVFRIVIGIWMIYESLVRINTSIKLHAANIQAWKYILIAALVPVQEHWSRLWFSWGSLWFEGWSSGLLGVEVPS